MQSGTELKMMYVYTKEELACMEEAAFVELIEKFDDNDFEEADIVVLLQLAHRPAAPYVNVVPNNMQSCGVRESFDTLLNEKLKSFKVVQVSQYAEDNAEEVEQSLLTIWYKPDKVTPGDALAYKNQGGKCTQTEKSVCLDAAQSQCTEVSITYDGHKAQCKEWPSYGEKYASSKSVLATSWTPNGGESFAIIGANFPDGYDDGKLDMQKRLMDDLQTIGVKDRAFILGDTNTRILPTAFNSCPNAACKQPEEEQKSLALAKRGDIGPCQDTSLIGSPSGYSSSQACTDALNTLVECRKQCIRDFYNDQNSFRKNIGPAWSEADAKRGAGGYDNLAEFFDFVAEFQKGASIFHSDKWRLPTYKREKAVCQPTPQGPTPTYPSGCQVGSCVNLATPEAIDQCYAKLTDLKGDTLPSGKQIVKAQMGWLDALGYSKALTSSITEVKTYRNRDDLTFGDHVPFVAVLNAAL
jgi:hypothetical protein